MQKTTVASSNPYLEINNQGKIVRRKLTRDRTEGADLIVPPDWNVISRCHAVLCRDGERSNHRRQRRQAKTSNRFAT